jgi:hypothetical protein
LVGHVKECDKAIRLAASASASAFFTPALIPSKRPASRSPSSPSSGDAITAASTDHDSNVTTDDGSTDDADENLAFNEISTFDQLRSVHLVQQLSQVICTWVFVQFFQSPASTKRISKLRQKTNKQANKQTNKQTNKLQKSFNATGVSLTTVVFVCVDVNAGIFTGRISTLKLPKQIPSRFVFTQIFFIHEVQFRTRVISKWIRFALSFLRTNSRPIEQSERCCHLLRPPRQHQYLLAQHASLSLSLRTRHQLKHCQTYIQILLLLLLQHRTLFNQSKHLLVAVHQQVWEEEVVVCHQHHHLLSQWYTRDQKLCSPRNPFG